MKRMIIGSTLVLFAVTGCGGGGGVSTIDKLPNITAPVTTSGLTTAAMNFRAQRNYLAAINGINFSASTNQETFSKVSGVSRAACEVFQVTRDLLDRASQADKTKCYVANTIAENPNAGFDPYDGEVHAFKLNFVSEGGPEGAVSPKIKMKIVRNGDRITDFKMWGCFGADETQQTEYLSMVIDSNNHITVVSKNIWSSGNSYQGSNWVDLAGVIDASGKYTSKNATVSNYGHQGENYWMQVATFNQFSDRLDVTAAQKGSNTWEGDSWTNISQAVAAVQLVDKNTETARWSPRNLWMGDGTVYVAMQNEGGGFSFENTETCSWAGDTIKNINPATSGEWYSYVGDNPTLPSVPALTDLTFSGDEAWDCSVGENPATIDVDQAGLEETCGYVAIIPDSEHDGSYINCWQLQEYN